MAVEEVKRRGMAVGEGGVRYRLAISCRDESSLAAFGLARGRRLDTSSSTEPGVMTADRSM